MTETTGILFDLFIIFAAARLAGELFLRLKQPAIVGEVLADGQRGSRSRSARSARGRALRWS